MAVDEAPPGQQDALREVLLGYMPASLARAFAALPTTDWASVSLTFFSFGDTGAITDVLDAYAHTPLVRRSARFPEAKVVSATSC